MKYLIIGSTPTEFIDEKMKMKLIGNLYTNCIWCNGTSMRRHTLIFVGVYEIMKYCFVYCSLVCYSISLKQKKVSLRLNFINCSLKYTFFHILIVYLLIYFTLKEINSFTLDLNNLSRYTI